MSGHASRREGPDGVAIVDKPAGWTSHDVVAKARGLLGTRKVGHAGTLDPDVTGVLVLGVGRATRLLRYASALGKTYEGTFVLGIETSTLDASGDVVAQHDMRSVTIDEVRSVIAQRFVGPILQVPPMVSAVKINGRRLHELARAGVEVVRDPRPVTVHSFTVHELKSSDQQAPEFSLQVSCSSGTYVRSLVADLGTALGGGAHLATLRRVAVGSFSIDEAIPIQSLTSEHLLGVDAAVRDLATVIVSDDLAQQVAHGARLDRETLGVAENEFGPWAVKDVQGMLLAVYEDHGGSRVKPSVVIAQVPSTPKPPES